MTPLPDRRRSCGLRATILRFGVAAGLLALGACSGPTGPDPRLAERLDAILFRHADIGAMVSARVLELPARRELYAVNVDAPVLPASNMKLITSAAALDALGPDASFTTKLLYADDNLYVIGSGDPGLGDPKIAAAHGEETTSVLSRWAEALKQRGITHVAGDLYYWDGALENQQIHPTWAHDDLVYWYAAPVSGLNFNDNCIDVTVYPQADGQPCGVEVTPPVTNLTLVNECVSGAAPRPTIDRLPFADVYVLGGGCTKRTTLPSKPINDPGAFFADALRTQLAVEGIVIDGETRALPSLPHGLLQRRDCVVAIEETQMHDVLWRTNQSSQNLFAECLLKMVGREYTKTEGSAPPGSWPSGQLALRAFLRRGQIADASLVFADGSGLSRDNRVTTRAVTDLLATMFTHPSGEAYRASLAEPGGEGTLRSRMKDLRGQVFAKTGYIRGVRALSGYVRTTGGSWLCFSIIYNQIPGRVTPFEELQDEACHVFAEWPELPDMRKNAASLEVAASTSRGSERRVSPIRAATVREWYSPVPDAPTAWSRPETWSMADY